MEKMMYEKGYNIEEWIIDEEMSGPNQMLGISFYNESESQPHHRRPVSTLSDNTRTALLNTTNIVGQTFADDEDSNKSLNTD